MTKFKSRLRSSSLLSLLLAGALAATSSSCTKKEEDGGAPAGSSVKKAPEETATRVEVAILEGGTMTGRFIRPGEVIGAREARLAAALGGYVEKVLVESGQTVTKGQVIARVDTSTHSAQLALARVEVKDAEHELERVNKLGKAVASARGDAARTRVARAKAQQRIASNRMERATIRAPFAGVLVDLQIEQGEVAAPGQPIGRLLVLDPIAVSVSVTDQDVHSLKAASPVKISTAGSSSPVQGIVSKIEPAADLRTRTFLVEVEAPNPNRRLLPGMIASVEFQPAESGEALLLPQDLLVTRLEDNGVFVVGKDSIAHWRPLELGSIIGSQVEITGGVARGERIVTVGMRSLSEGDKVITTRQGVCCTNGAVIFDLGAKKAPVPAARTAPAAPSAPAPNAAASKGAVSK